MRRGESCVDSEGDGEAGDGTGDQAYSRCKWRKVKVIGREARRDTVRWWLCWRKKANNLFKAEQVMSEW